MKKLPIGIDNYCLHPLGLSPLEVLKWARENQAEGVQFSGLHPEDAAKVDESYLRELAAYTSENSLYLEWGEGQHIPFDMETWKEKDIFPINRRAAEQASILGTRIVRSCSGGLMRWDDKSPMTETLLQKMAESLIAQRQMLRDNNVLLALETHFEFTTHELFWLLERCEAEPGDFLGICLDTMNLLTMLEDPLEATQRILPWIVSTHIKDGAVLLNEEGLVTFPAEIGLGVIDLQEICHLLTQLPEEVHLSIEDHGGSFHLPVFDPLFRSKFPDLTTGEFARIVYLALQTKEKMDKGKLAITEREDWPHICEPRIKRDILALKQMLRQH
jgi:sugar phosphate isomerase/epimerase